MNSHDFTQIEIDERAYAIFLMEGIQYFLDQDPSLHQGSIQAYCSRLWNRWHDMSQNEKTPFYDRAIDELHRLRRYRRADIYRSIMRDDNNPDETQTRRRNNNPRNIIH
jgi:hypothetical protein